MTTLATTHPLAMSTATSMPSPSRPHTSPRYTACPVLQSAARLGRYAGYRLILGERIDHQRVNREPLVEVGHPLRILLAGRPLTSGMGLSANGSGRLLPSSCRLTQQQSPWPDRTETLARVKAGSSCPGLAEAWARALGSESGSGVGEGLGSGVGEGLGSGARPRARASSAPEGPRTPGPPCGAGAADADCSPTTTAAATTTNTSS